MDIYARALQAVPKEQRKSVIDIYVSRASDFFGIAKASLSKRGNVLCCATQTGRARAPKLTTLQLHQRSTAGVSTTRCLSLQFKFILKL